MAENTKIEWADSTWNPWIGCTKVSPACDAWVASSGDWRQPLLWNERADNFRQCGACGWRGDIIIRAEPIPMPCPKCGAVDHLPARRRVFCASLAPISWLADLLSLIYSTPSLDWLLLTKRIGNWRARIYAAVDLFEHRMVVSGRGDNHGYAMARNWLAGEAPANVWLGATICNQAEADRDIPKLLAVPAAKRFLSIEPMLGPVQFWPCWLRIGCGFGGDHDPARTHCFPCGAGKGYDTKRCAWPSQRIDWIICGGESGPHARPMHPDWVRSLRGQCAAAGVPFFMQMHGKLAELIAEENRRFTDGLPF